VYTQVGQCIRSSIVSMGRNIYTAFNRVINSNESGLKIHQKFNRLKCVIYLAECVSSTSAFIVVYDHGMGTFGMSKHRLRLFIAY
jgi:hypothetical protein